MIFDSFILYIIKLYLNYILISMKKSLIKKVLSYFTSKQKSEYENIEETD